jgi:hypothetical protein
MVGGQTVGPAAIQPHGTREFEAETDIEFEDQNKFESDDEFESEVEFGTAVDWAAPPEPQEVLVESESMADQNDITDLLQASGRETRFPSVDDEQVVDHQESGSYQINVDFEGPVADGKAVLAFMAHTAAIERTVDLEAENDTGDAIELETTAERSEPESDIVTLEVKLPTIETITDVAAEVDFVDTVPKEPQESAPSAVRVVEVNEVNRDNADPSKPRRRFKQLFSNLTER